RGCLDEPAFITWLCPLTLPLPRITGISRAEPLASLNLNWGPQKLRRLAELERHVVVVHISDPGVRQAYAELSTLSQSSGWSLFHGKNDFGLGPRHTPPTRIF